MKQSKFQFRAASAFIVIIIVCGTNILDAYAKLSKHVYLKAQFLSLKEFDSHGNQTREESGGLLGIGYKLIPEQDSSSICGDGELYLGVVGYDGQSQNGESFKDKNKYTGLNLNGNINLFLCNLFSEERSLMAIGGLGVNSWIRSINLIHTEYGYREIWTNFYGRAGLGLYLTKNVYLSGGAKVPFWTSKHIGDFDIELNPRGRTGAFFETSVMVSHFSLYLFYESNRFKKSYVKTQTVYQYYGWQPESKGRVIGFSLRSRF
jgi:hypothetical protein